MGQVIDAIFGLGGAGAYVVVGLLAFGEAAAFVGLVLPGEVAVLLGGVLASRGQVSLPLILLVAAVAAIAGDSAGYEIGRRWGRRLVGTRFLRRRADAVRDVERYVRRHGGVVMFLGRWTSVLRAFVPSVAGMGRMPYGRFLVFNIVGGVAWAAVFTLAGYAAGESYAVVDALTGRAAWILTGVLVAWVAVNLVRRRRVRSRWFAVDVGVWSDATSHGLCPSGATWTRTAALLWSGRGRTTWHHEAAPPATTAEHVMRRRSSSATYPTSRPAAPRRARPGWSTPARATTLSRPWVATSLWLAAVAGVLLVGHESLRCEAPHDVWGCGDSG